MTWQDSVLLLFIPVLLLIYYVHHYVSSLEKEVAHLWDYVTELETELEKEV